MNKHFVAYFFATVTVIIWGSTFVITKVLLDYVTPLQLLVLRYFVVVVFLIIIYPKFNVKFDKKREVVFMLSGISLSLYFIFENNAINNTYASNVSLIIATIPLQTSIIKSIIHKKSFFTKIGFIGVIISYIGVSIIVVDGNGLSGVKFIGDLLAFIAAISFVFYSVFLEKTDNDIHIIVKTRKIFIYGFIIMFIYYLISGEKVTFEMLNGQVILGVLYLGIVASGLAFIIWNQSVKWMGSIKTNIFTYLVPVITLIFSFLILHEIITIYKLLGGIIILVGIFLSENESIKNKRNENSI